VIATDSACEAYYDLRNFKIQACGLDVFMKQGMLEWMKSLGKSSVASVRVVASMENPNTKHDEIVALLANMMEAVLNGV
jgi:hypothetical protein